MKICFLCETYHRYRGGIESFVHVISRTLINKGHEVHIITLSGEEKYYLKDSNIKNLHIHKINLEIQPFPGFWRINEIFPLYELYYPYYISKILNRFVEKHSIDIFETAILNFWYFRKKIPIVIRLHGYAGFENGCDNRESFLKIVRNKIKKFIERELLEKADKVVAVSYSHAEATRKLLNLNNHLNIDVIHNGIDLEKFSLPGTNIHRALNVLFVGRIKREKGVDGLIKAIPKVLESFPETKFFFIGMDSEHPELKGSYIEFLKNTVNDNRVIFLGALSHEEVMNYYKSNLICVFPSLFLEPFSLVTIEAMASGCAVIATRHGGFTEIIEDNKDGLLVPPGDYKVLANAIKKLLSDRELLNALIKNATKKVKAKFSIDMTVGKTLEVFNSAIKNFYGRNKVSVSSYY